MESKLFRNKQFIKKALLGAALIGLGIYLRRPLLLIVKLLFGGWLVAFLLEPLCEAFARYMKRGFAVALSFAAALTIIALFFYSIFTPLMGQIGELIDALPTTIEYLQTQLMMLNDWLMDHNLFLLEIPEINLTQITGNLRGIMSGTVGFAGIMVDSITQGFMIAILAFYFLLDKERFLFKMELLIPFAFRKPILRVACAVKRELKIYLRGQLIISAIIGSISAVAFYLIGLPSFSVLAIIVGVFNLIPYFGPVLGGIPAVVFAMRMGVPAVLKTLLTLFLVQQIDGFILSPRIMSNVTGFSPPVVLVAIAAAGSLGGIGGMFFALPCLLIGKICARVYTNHNLMIEKGTEV